MGVKTGIIRLIIFLFVIMGLAIYSLATTEEEYTIEDPIIREPILPEEDNEEEYIPEEPEEEEEEELDNSIVGRPPVVNPPRVPTRPSIPRPQRPPVVTSSPRVLGSTTITNGTLRVNSNVSNVRDVCWSFTVNAQTCNNWRPFTNPLNIPTPNNRIGEIIVYIWYRSSDGIVSPRQSVTFTNHVRVDRLPIGSRLTITGDPFGRTWIIHEARSGGMLLIANRVFGPELFDAQRDDQEVYDYLQDLDGNFSPSFKNRLRPVGRDQFYVTIPDRAVAGINISGPYNTFAGIIQGVQGNPHASILPVILIRNNQLVTSQAANGIFHIN